MTAIWKRGRSQAISGTAVDNEAEHRETVQVDDVSGLQRLIQEYGRLRRLEGHSPQSRGQRFNEIIAEMLRCWGVSASVSIRAKGEIDVAFAVDGTRYVLEAKWETAKANTGHIAKLQKRVRQRLAGTYGVFLSLAGYTPAALTDVSDGERLEVLLLERGHFEAMLSGLLPPRELLSLVHDRAAFHGEAYTPLEKVLSTSVAPPPIRIGEAESLREVLRNAVPGVTGQVVVSNVESRQLGVASQGAARLLLTTQHGILGVNLATSTSRWAAPIHGCHSNALPCDGDAILFTRRHGVGRFRNGAIDVMGGGFAANSSLMRHPDGSNWVLSTDFSGNQAGSSITRLGENVGDEERHDIDDPTGHARSAVWLTDRDVLMVGNQYFCLATLIEGCTRHFPSRQSNPSGAVKVADDLVLTAGDEVTLVLTNVRTGAYAEIAKMALLGSVYELAMSEINKTVYLASYYPEADGRMTYAVVQVELPANLALPILATESIFSDQAGLPKPTWDEILRLAQAVEEDHRQRAVERRFATRAEAIAARDELKQAIADDPVITHVRPWIWTMASGGEALTLSGRETGIELRMSYYQTTTGDRPDFDPVWTRIVELTGEIFTQKTGRPFTYAIAGTTLIPSTTNRALPRSHFARAYERMPLRGPGEIQDLQGPSYIFAILTDPRITIS
jgi:hypothetical protein